MLVLIMHKLGETMAPLAVGDAPVVTMQRQIQPSANGAERARSLMKAARYGGGGDEDENGDEDAEYRGGNDAEGAAKILEVAVRPNSQSVVQKKLVAIEEQGDTRRI